MRSILLILILSFLVSCNKPLLSRGQCITNGKDSYLIIKYGLINSRVTDLKGNIQEVNTDSLKTYKIIDCLEFLHAK